MKRILALLLLVFSAQAAADEVNSVKFTRDDLIGQWKCKTEYKNEEGNIIAMELRDGVNYRDGTNEGVGNFLVNIAGQTFIYQIRGKGLWRLEGDIMYSNNVTARFERNFPPELTALLQQDPELKSIEETAFLNMQKSLDENIINNRQTKARILEFNQDASLSQEITDNGLPGAISICSKEE